MIRPTENQEAVKKYLPYILATAIFMQMLDSTILNTSLPAIASDLNESTLDMQNAIISYVLTLAIFIPVSGFLADKFGTRRIFIIALVIFSIGSVFCAMSQTLNQLVMSRITQGLGGALMTPVGRLALIKTYEKSEFVRAMNYAIIPALIGPVLGPLIGGYMVDYFSWHWIFLINIPFGLFGILLGMKYMPDFRADTNKFDFKGFLIFGSASLILSVSLEMMGNPTYMTFVLVALMAGFIMLYFYYRHAKIKTAPLFPLSLFLIRTFRIGIIGNLVTRLGIGAIPLLVPLMIQMAYGESAVVSGWIVAPMALTSMLSKSTVIPILDRFGYRNTLKYNTMIIGAIIIILAIPGKAISVYWFIPIIAVLGFFNSIQFTAMNSISIADLRDNQTSSGNTLLSVNQQLAVGFGIAIGLTILRLFQQSDVLVGENMHAAFKYTFVVVGMFTILSSFIFRRLHITDGDNLKTIKG